MIDLLTRRFVRLRALAVVIVLLGAWSAALPAAADGITAEQERLFETRIRPVLVGECYSCHGPDKQKSGLRLDSETALRKGGDSGFVIDPDRPEASLLLDVLNHRGDITMPPKKKLEAETIKAFEAWVKQGAPWPTRGGAKPATDDPFENARRTYWSLQPIEKPQPPQVKDASLIGNDVDRFVVAKLEAKGLSPSPRADRRMLIRRAYFDLIGLPPTFEQVQAFVNDPAPHEEAWAKVIDELLASPHYGERWGRHWLDVARYADTKGYIGVGREIRYPFSYTYRDYVIRAFNDDKPYDAFIREQLAADKLHAAGELKHKRDLAAMGLLTVGRRFINNEQEIIDDRIDVITRGFLGLTVACARCHDHKYDPIPTADYYSLYGVFASSREPDESELPVIGEPKPSPEYEQYKQEIAKRQKAVDDYLVQIRHKAMDEARQRTSIYLFEIVNNDPRFKHIIDKLPESKPNMMRRRHGEQWWNWLHQWEGKHHPVFSVWHWFAKLDQSPAKFGEEAKALIARFDELEKQRGPINPLVRKAFEASPPKTFIDVAATLGKLCDETDKLWRDASKQNPKLASLEDEAREQIRHALYGNDSPTFVSEDLDEVRRFTQRDERNHFRSLERKVDELRVSSPAAPPRAMIMTDEEKLSDPHVFERGQRGRRGERVPRRFLQLLEHVDGGKTYDQTSGRLELARAIADPENPLTARVFVNRVWHHHFGVGFVATNSDFGIRSDPPVQSQLLDYLAARFMEEGWSIKKLHRLIMHSRTYQQRSDHRAEAYAVDSENALWWKFNRQRLSFEPLRDALLVVAGRLDRTLGGRGVDLEARPFTTRRSVYAFIDRQNLPGLFRTFDLAIPEASSPKRPVTTTPQQALYMMNSPFAIEQVKHAAARVPAEGAIDERIDALYRIVLSREATDDERAVAHAFLLGDSGDEKNNLNAWEQLTLALMLSNEFVFVD